MSMKSLDNKNRWRSKTVAFRMSPEEAAQLDVLARLSGLSKQDYLIKRVLEQEVTVQPNPRVYKALRNQFDDVLSELRRLDAISPDNDELFDLIAHIANILHDMKGD